MTDNTRLPEAIARKIFGASDDPASVRRAIRGWLLGAVSAAVLVPVLFLLRFGQVGGLGWGLTVFLVALSLLAALGLYFLRRPAYHSPVPLRGDWRDRVGAFWLVACALGPFVGWVIVSVPVLTLANWRWLYAARVLFSAGLPVLTALPLLRYVRGRGAPIMLALLVLVTALPIWAGWSSLQDLLAGPAGLTLTHTAQNLLP